MNRMWEVVMQWGIGLALLSVLFAFAVLLWRLALGLS
jgi:hypothetical protein